MYNIGDKVFVIDWDQQYSNVWKWINREKILIFNWKTEIPNYSGIDHHWHFEYEPNLTLKGTVNKRDPQKLKSKTPKYKDYKYEILETTNNPMTNEIIYLIASIKQQEIWAKCFVQISEEGLSLLNSEQFANQQFNGLIESNLGKWTIDTMKNAPQEIRKFLYDTNQRAQFGDSMTRATIRYPYLEGKFTVNGNNLCYGWEMSYDGGCDLNDKEIISWDELTKKFPENRFQ